MRKVVNVTTQEQWNKVTRVMNLEWPNRNAWLSYEKESCINIDDGLYCDKSFYQGQGVEIITFDQWKDEYCKTDFTFDQFNSNVIQWANDKDLIKYEGRHVQLIKVMEELGELSSAILKNQPHKIIDGMGDTFVTLTILSAQLGLDPMKCMKAAWNEIKDRKGTNVNGTFIKEA